MFILKIIFVCRNKTNKSLYFRTFDRTLSSIKLNLYYENQITSLNTQILFCEQIYFTYRKHTISEKVSFKRFLNGFTMVSTNPTNIKKLKNKRIELLTQWQRHLLNLFLYYFSLMDSVQTWSVNLVHRCCNIYLIIYLFYDLSVTTHCYKTTNKNIGNLSILKQLRQAVLKQLEYIHVVPPTQQKSNERISIKYELAL